MPTAETVKPRKWSKQKVLFDNGWYSVISGIYDGKGPRVLGERWSGGNVGLGFPNVSGNPVWHVIPEFLAIPVLTGLIEELAVSPTEQPKKHFENILQELRIQHECRCNRK
jgi:hypothetical protein